MILSETSSPTVGGLSTALGLALPVVLLVPAFVVLLPIVLLLPVILNVCAVGKYQGSASPKAQEAQRGWLQ